MYKVKFEKMVKGFFPKSFSDELNRVVYIFFTPTTSTIAGATAAAAKIRAVFPLTVFMNSIGLFIMLGQR
jgi:hypothetical protein